MKRSKAKIWPLIMISSPVKLRSFRDFSRYLQILSRKNGIGRKLSVFFILAALASSIATYAAWTGWAPFGTRVQSIVLFLKLDAALFVIVATIVIVRIVKLWIERRRGAAGSKLHTRLVLLFGFVAVAPTIIVAVSSAVVFTQGVESWFNNVVRSALNESNAIASAYVEENRRYLRDDILGLANEFSRMAQKISKNPEQIQSVLAAEAELRELHEASIINANGKSFASWSRSGLVLFGDPVPSWAMNEVRETGGLIIFRTPEGDSLRGLIQLEAFVDAYLDVSRKVSPGVLSRIDRTRRAVERYKDLEGRRSQIEITLAAMFIFVSLMILLVAVWLGLLFAARLARPISELVDAAELVRDGNLEIRVDEKRAPDELGTLSRAFNRMTEQLLSQRSSLVKANSQLEQRRYFIETVLSGVSSCIVGIDSGGLITVTNKAAEDQFFFEHNSVIGDPLMNHIPECRKLFDKAINISGGEQINEEVSIKIGGQERTFFVRFSSDVGEDNDQGYVVTFDDVSELLEAQKKAAWADVARRIAHEIKNPLTPIQLAAERLRRKYTPQIKADLAAFEDCTETIIRQVGGIGRLVDEFSSFARMPAPVMKDEDIVKLCNETLVLFGTAHKHIQFKMHSSHTSFVFFCDRNQLMQALTNLLQNSVDSITACERHEEQHQIGVFLETNEFDDVKISVFDTGKGLPDDRGNLTDPYVTTRDKGTGLGLAIVKKIMDDHGGEVILANKVKNGACVSLILPRVVNKEALGSGSLTSGQG